MNDVERVVLLEGLSRSKLLEGWLGEGLSEDEVYDGVEDAVEELSASLEKLNELVSHLSVAQVRITALERSGYVLDGVPERMSTHLIDRLVGTPGSVEDRILEYIGRLRKLLK